MGWLISYLRKRVIAFAGKETYVFSLRKLTDKLTMGICFHNSSMMDFVQRKCVSYENSLTIRVIDNLQVKVRKDATRAETIVWDP